MKTKAGIGTLLLLIVCAGGGLVLLHVDDDDQVALAQGAASESEGSFGKDKAQFARVTPGSSDGESLRAPPSNPLFLGDECPELLDEGVAADEDCLDAVERHFMDKAAYVVKARGMVPRDAPFTYAAMFDRHPRDLESVVEALSRPECRLLEGPIRMDLRETCNAEAFFRYTYFSSVCRRAADWKEAFQPLSTLWDEVSLQGTGEVQVQLLTPEERAAWESQSRYQYWLVSSKDRNATRERLLMDIWLASKKCPSHVVDGSLSHFDGVAPNEELRHWWTEGTQETWRDQRRRDAVEHGYHLPPEWETGAGGLVEPHKLLQAIAARLGFEWTLMGGSFDRGTPLGYIPGAVMDREFMDSKREHHLWSSQLGEALALSPRGRTDAVVHAVRGVVGMRKAGYEADIEYIVESLCDTDLEWRKKGAKDCATAFKDAGTRLDPQDIIALRVLDEIEAEARKLESYQYF